MTIFSPISFAIYGFFIIVFIAFSWYFVRRILEMRFQGDKSFLAVKIYSFYCIAILLLTLIALIINNLL